MVTQTQVLRRVGFHHEMKRAIGYVDYLVAGLPLLPDGATVAAVEHSAVISYRPRRQITENAAINIADAIYSHRIKNYRDTT